MKMKLISVTLSAVILCSCGLFNSVKAINMNQSNSSNISRVAHNHAWKITSKTLKRTYQESEKKMGKIRFRTVKVYDVTYICFSCNSKKTGTVNEPGAWTPWTPFM